MRNEWETEIVNVQKVVTLQELHTILPVLSRLAHFLKLQHDMLVNIKKTSVSSHTIDGI